MLSNYLPDGALNTGWPGKVVLQVDVGDNLEPH
jgi:hypothetical protein